MAEKGAVCDSNVGGRAAYTQYIVQSDATGDALNSAQARWDVFEFGAKSQMLTINLFLSYSSHGKGTTLKTKHACSPHSNSSLVLET